MCGQLLAGPAAFTLPDLFVAAAALAAIFAVGIATPAYLVCNRVGTSKEKEKNMRRGEEAETQL